MWFKHRAWIPVAWSLSILNIGAVWFAARPGETWHATAHAFLAVLFALGARRLAARRQTELPGEDLKRALDDNERLQLTVDGLEAQLTGLQERVEFAERLVLQQKSPDRQGGATPGP